MALSQGYLRQRKCKACKGLFVALRPMQSACSPECAMRVVDAAKVKRQAQEQREERKSDAMRRLKLQTKKELMESVQAIVNRYVRLRDKDRPCISCGTEVAGQWHAGHYRNTWQHPELRYHLDNIHKQCAQCNRFKHGNLANYRLGLIERIGLERVEALENWPRPLAKWSTDDLWEIRRTFLTKIKEAKKGPA